MRIVADEFEIFVLKIVDVPDRRVQLHDRQSARFARQLKAGLFDVVIVEVEVAKGMNECSRLEIADLRHHQGEQCVGGDVEGHAEEEIRAALVKLAAQL